MITTLTSFKFQLIYVPAGTKVLLFAVITFDQYEDIKLEFSKTEENRNNGLICSKRVSCSSDKEETSSDATTEPETTDTLETEDG